MIFRCNKHADSSHRTLADQLCQFVFIVIAGKEKCKNIEEYFLKSDYDTVMPKIIGT